MAGSNVTHYVPYDAPGMENPNTQRVQAVCGVYVGRHAPNNWNGKMGAEPTCPECLTYFRRFQQECPF